MESILKPDCLASEPLAQAPRDALPGRLTWADLPLAKPRTRPFLLRKRNRASAYEGRRTPKSGLPAATQLWRRLLDDCIALQQDTIRVELSREVLLQDSPRSKKRTWDRGCDFDATHHRGRA